MLIKVFNKRTTQIEIIDSSQIDETIHFHRNTHQPLDKKLYNVETIKKQAPTEVLETKTIETIREIEKPRRGRKPTGKKL